MHSGGGKLWWTWGVTALLFAAIIWLSTAPLVQEDYDASEARVLSAAEQVFADAAGFEDVMGVIPGRCSMCHAREPYYEGIHRAPKGILLETEADVIRAAREVYIQSGVTNAMPPANVSFMEDAERQIVARWYRAATGGQKIASN
jgi:uncharacterized membrane protein